MAGIKTSKKRKSAKKTELSSLKETILYTTLCRSTSRRIYLRKGQKIQGEISLIRRKSPSGHVSVKISEGKKPP